ncbi:FO synthase [Williamsia sterculiae]|uniref:FO synthase subunit 2 n=1 Tax=Williamsia sterculiae TaxID=1344003 RepID=A0A1N7FRV4_9NOCA|nr:FO synthase [Williamsia sterculiae]SIS03050.1 FO synthase subunit 2 [Williamsia sterculiae]
MVGRASRRAHWGQEQLAPVDDVRSALVAVRDDATQVGDDQWAALLGADGPELEELAVVADAVRRDRVGDDLTVVVNRNLDTAAVVGFDDPRRLEDLVGEAVAAGATEICMQGGVPADADPALYLDIPRRIVTAAPGLHLHAYRPPELLDAARRLHLPLDEVLGELCAAGVASVPGTAAQILDDDIRSALTGVGAVFPTADWVRTISAAHGAGLRSTATLVYGHLETRTQQVAHLRTLAGIQARTGGFTELIPMPVQQAMAPPELRDQAGAGPGARETRAVHAVARLLLAGSIDHIQVAWTKLDREVVLDVLRGGVDDLGGLLLDGVLMPEAGAEAGRVLTPADVAQIAAELGRPVRQRTTLYDDPPADAVTVTAAERV